MGAPFDSIGKILLVLALKEEIRKLRSDVSLLQADKNRLGQELAKKDRDIESLRQCNKGLQANISKEIDENERLREANKSTVIVRPTVHLNSSVSLPDGGSQDTCYAARRIYEKLDAIHNQLAKAFQ